MRKILHWLDDNALFLITGFLLAFIPLFPKLPLFEAIPGYIVRVRLEDFLISIALIIWLVQLWRKKAKFGPNPLSRPILAYLTVGILSMLSAVFITKTVPMEGLHIGKMVLHYLRRVEYFSLFFVFYSSVKSVKQIKIYLGIIIITVLGVTIYGYGQKYFYWPAFSTMNREFSKGWALYLTQHARVLSTFGGHYDLAAYTMIVLIFLWGLFFSISKIWLKLVIFIILGAAFWLLILTASRTSFIAYLVGVTVLFIFWTFKNGIKWSLRRYTGVVILSIFVMLSFGDLSERFTKLLKIDQRIGGIKALLLRPIGAPPNNSEITLLENNLQAVTSKSDFPPLPVRPTDVENAIPEGTIASTSASGTAYFQEKQRTYSKTALVYDLSTGIRLDALWPMAIKGFKKNPLLGSGYSTLNKASVEEFTEAESTDNDFLRALGETGILGLLTFGWILFTIIAVVWKTFLRIKGKTIFGLAIGLAAVTFGLLVNAVYIDIFEASKIALSFWALTGIILGAIKVSNVDILKADQKMQIPDLVDVTKAFKKTINRIIRSDITYLIILLIIAFVLRIYKIHQPLADWHSWRQADTSAVTRNFVRYGINALYPRYDDLSSVPSGKPNPEGFRFVEFPLYNIFAVVVDKLFPGYTVEFSGRLTSVFASLVSLIFLYFLTKKYLGFRTGLFTAFFFAVLPYNIFWSRTILPEPTLVCLNLGMLYFFDKWLEIQKFRHWLLSLLFGIGALLVKFTTVFFAFPIVYLIWKKWKWTAFRQIRLYLYAVLIIIPFFAWRWHISNYPEGIPAYTWLFNGNGIRFKGAWFWWLFFERIVKLILGGWGVGLLSIGLIRPINQIGKKGAGVFLVWIVAMIVYLAVFATGNVQHDYYQIILVPILCVFLGIGAEWLLINPGKIFSSINGKIILLLCIIFMLMFGWYQARDFYNINHPEIVDAGREFDRKINNNQVKVIAPYNGDTAFLYQTSRRGWPIMDGTIDEMIFKGAHYYISVNFDDLTNKLIDIARKDQDLKYRFKIIDINDKFVIIQLVPDKLLP